ncbi:tetratricopeptide repeat protein [candidate division KSB1 bacterium]|nr:tetratricopeptide repeat protein [candidate division KSB1 bacterium]
MRIPKIIHICFLIGLLALPVSSIASGDAGQAGVFLQYNIGSRALGMGRAFVAAADDASAIFWNPAGMVNASRMEFSSMYSNLFYDSQYASAGFVLPRPKQHIDNPILRYLYGTGSAIGFGWVGLNMSGFDQRTETGQLVGNFNFGENAFIGAWSHEHVHPWAILQYGLAFKGVNQRFPGVVSSPTTQLDGNANWSKGLDVGMMLQPIHMPILRLIALRYLLPLRIGVSMQNVMQPQWSNAADERDVFPMIVRAGLSYRVQFRDWIPKSWESVYDWMHDSSVLLAFDREYMNDREAGLFFGMEGRFPVFHPDALFSPRFGFNNRTEGPSFGFGFSIPFAETAELSLDYAIGFHPYMSEDSRFFLSIRFGQKKGASFFQKLAGSERASARESKQHLLRIVAAYPNRWVEDSVLRLAATGDSAYVGRYFELVDGVGRARWLLYETRALINDQDFKGGSRKAFEASTVYAPVFLKPDNTLQEQDLMDFSEVLIYAGLMDDAVLVLREVEPDNLETYYSMGIAQKGAGDLDEALESFRKAVQQFEDEGDQRSQVCLSLMNIGEILIQKQQYASARITFETVIDNYKEPLNRDYPRFQIYRDNRSQDDAQFLLGITRIMNKEYQSGLADVAGAYRFYPNYEFGKVVTESIDQLAELVRREDWSAFHQAAESLFNAYLDAHDISAQ